MKHKINIKNILFIGFIILLLFLFSCRPEDTSIFWALANTTKEEDHSLDNKLSIIDMTNDGIHNYIAAGGSMWKRDIDASPESTWSSIQYPSGAEICTAMTITDDNNEIYAGFHLSNNSEGLYKSSLSEFSPSNPDWVKQDDVDINGQQIIRLKILNSRLFISTMDISGGENNPKYNLYYLDSNDYKITGLNDKNEYISDITWDETDEYWAITGDEIYKLSDSDLTIQAVEIENGRYEPSSNISKRKYGGIFYSSAKIYVSDKNGYIYMTDDDGSSWNISERKPPEEKDDPIIFSEFGEINSNILVGTSGYGFYQMTNGELTSLNEPDSENPDLLLSTDLDECTIRRFHVQAGINKVYFCTIADGLYSNTYDGSSWESKWIHE